MISFVSDANLFTKQSMNLNNGSKIIRVFELRRKTKDAVVSLVRDFLSLFLLMSSPRHTFSSENSKLRNYGFGSERCCC